ncbi:BrnA antitoxin family protein [Acidithiobacillus ferruginosus]
MDFAPSYPFAGCKRHLSKERVTIRLSGEVVACFRASGRDPAGKPV